MSNYKIGDLVNLIPEDVLMAKLLSGDSEIDPEFLCFEENYVPIANNVPVDFTIVDCGCYMAAQAYLFQNHKKYIGVDSYDKNAFEDYIPPERFLCENSEHYSCTIDEFLKSDQFKSLDLNKTYFICSGVPAFESTMNLFNKVNNCAVFYPGMKDLIKGINREQILLNRTLEDERMHEEHSKTVVTSNYTYTHTITKNVFDENNFKEELDLNSIEEVKNPEKGDWWVKPEGGLWLSVNNGWERWCENNEPEWIEGRKRYEVTLKKDANILLIDRVEDLENLPKNKDMVFASKIHVGLDFEELAKRYDGIQVMINDDTTANISYSNSLYQKLYGWDCDSVVLFNKDCIEKIKEIEPIVSKKPEPNLGGLY